MKFTHQNRTPIRLSDIPDSMKQATIAIEDKEFYQHQGFSIKGMIRAGRKCSPTSVSCRAGRPSPNSSLNLHFLPDVSVIRKLKK